MRVSRFASRCIGIFALLIPASVATAGVTVHFEGKAKDAAAVTRAVAAARSEAQRRGWTVHDANVTSASVLRIVGEEEKPYKGPLTGIVIRAHPMCEPLYLQFGVDLFLQDYVKTQFAGPEVHIAIVDLLRSLKPYFRTLDVEDEGEYWTTRDRARLEAHMKTVNDMIDALKVARPGTRGPVKIAGERFVDFME